MLKMNLKAALVGAVFAVLGIVGPVGEATARIYSGTFDPLDFLGTFTYTISDACDNLANGAYLVPGSCDPNQSITALEATIFDVTDPQNPVTLATLTFAPPPNAPNSFFWYDGDVLALDTGLIGPRFFSPTPYWLSFGWVDNTCVGIECVPAPPVLPRVYLFDGTCHSVVNDVPSSCFPNQVPVATATDVQFIRVSPDVVPEPGTLALIGGALAAGWLSRRRVRKH